MNHLIKIQHLAHALYVYDVSGHNIAIIRLPDSAIDDIADDAPVTYISLLRHLRGEDVMTYSEALSCAIRAVMALDNGAHL